MDPIASLLNLIYAEPDCHGDAREEIRVHVLGPWPADYAPHVYVHVLSWLFPHPYHTKGADLNPDNHIDTAPVGVFGLGNVLMGDDALEPTVIAHLLAGFDFPPEVHVEDLGTPGLDLHPHLAKREALVLIDVVKSEGEPGELRLYRKEEILRHAPGPRVSPHDPGVKEALPAAEAAVLEELSRLGRQVTAREPTPCGGNLVGKQGGPT
jgi:hydrogenase maturation protease